MYTAMTKDATKKDAMQRKCTLRSVPKSARRHFHQMPASTSLTLSPCLKEAQIMITMFIITQKTDFLQVQQAINVQFTILYKNDIDRDYIMKHIV